MKNADKKAKKEPLPYITLFCTLCVTLLFLIFFIVNLCTLSLKVLPIAAIVILAALFPVVLRRRLHFVVRLIFTLGMAFYLVTFSGLCVYVATYNPVASEENIAALSHADGDESKLLVLVFGCRTYDTPGKTLTRRLDTAAGLLNEYPDAAVMVSGGQGKNEPRTEASAMAEYLVSLGIDEGRIYLEEKASSTIENIDNSLAMINESDGLSGRTLVCVSSSFHMRRISLLLENAGVGEYLLLGAPEGDIFTLTANMVREYMSYVFAFVLFPV